MQGINTFVLHFLCCACNVVLDAYMDRCGGESTVPFHAVIGQE